MGSTCKLFLAAIQHAVHALGSVLEAKCTSTVRHVVSAPPPRPCRRSQDTRPAVFRVKHCLPYNSMQLYDAPLSGLWVGMWRAPSRSKLTFLSLPGPRQFVLLVESGPSRRTSLSDLAARAFPSTPKDITVRAFELPWQGLVGLDYSNPLCSAGRVVLEARGVRLRVFKTVRRGGEAPGGWSVCVHPVCHGGAALADGEPGRAWPAAVGAGDPRCGAGWRP